MGIFSWRVVVLTQACGSTFACPANIRKEITYRVFQSLKAGASKAWMIGLHL